MAGKDCGTDTDARKKASQLKAMEALKLRLQSMSWPKIADALGYSGPSGPYQAVQKLMQELPAEDAAEFRRLECERLEEIRAGLKPYIERDKKSLEAYLGVTDRLHRVMGVAQKHEHSGPNGQPIQVITGVPEAEEPKREAAG